MYIWMDHEWPDIGGYLLVLFTGRSLSTEVKYLIVKDV